MKEGTKALGVLGMSMTVATLAGLIGYDVGSKATAEQKDAEIAELRNDLDLERELRLHDYRTVSVYRELIENHVNRVGLENLTDDEDLMSWDGNTLFYDEYWFPPNHGGFAIGMADDAYFAASVIDYTIEEDGYVKLGDPYRTAWANIHSWTDLEKPLETPDCNTMIADL